MKSPSEILNYYFTTIIVTFLEMHQRPLEKLGWLPGSTFRLIPKPLLLKPTGLIITT